MRFRFDLHTFPYIISQDQESYSYGLRQDK